MLEPQRNLEEYLLGNREDLEKMVFVVGPRQVGKTTLLNQLSHKLISGKQIHVFNWDKEEDKRVIRSPNFDHFDEILANHKGHALPVVFFDEIHKYRKWKTFLKGFYDTFKGRMTILVTGSARLDTYRRGGDSMLGRYWLFHLNPITLSEALHQFNKPPPQKLSATRSTNAQKIYTRLFRFGGFPEPFFKSSSAHHRRWVKMRQERLVREDIRDLSRIHDLSDVSELMVYLRESITSSFSINSVREKMGVSHNAVKNWLQWLEAVYYCVKVPPYSKKIARSLSKEGKYYLYDWSELADEAKRFENMMAMQLKANVDYWNDAGIGNFCLHYVRDQQKREVDFLITREDKPWLLVESKLSETEIPISLTHMARYLKPEHCALVTHTPTSARIRVIDGIHILVSQASEFLANLG